MTKKGKEVESDYGTPELNSHFKMVTEKADKGSRKRNTSQSHLDVLKNRKHIDFFQWEAGNRLLEMYFKAGRMPFTSVILDPERIRTSGGIPGSLEMSESQVYNWQKLNKVLKGLDTSMQLIVLEMCIYDVLACDIERALKTKRGYAMNALRFGLDHVACKLGLIAMREKTIRAKKYDL